jgi:hypothetical protein
LLREPHSTRARVCVCVCVCVWSCVRRLISASR